MLANHGAACSNVVFCEPGTHFVELPEVQYPCYESLAVRSGLHYHTTTQALALALVQCLWRVRNFPFKDSNLRKAIYHAVDMNAGRAKACRELEAAERVRLANGRELV